MQRSAQPDIEDEGVSVTWAEPGALVHHGAAHLQLPHAVYSGGRRGDCVHGTPPAGASVESTVVDGLMINVNSDQQIMDTVERIQFNEIAEEQGASQTEERTVLLWAGFSCASVSSPQLA